MREWSFPFPARTGLACASFLNSITPVVSSHPFWLQLKLSGSESLILYDVALDTLSPLPLLNALTHPIYLTSSPRIRELLTYDGGSNVSCLTSVFLRLLWKAVSLAYARWSAALAACPGAEHQEHRSSRSLLFLTRLPLRRGRYRVHLRVVAGLQGLCGWAKRESGRLLARVS